MGVERFLPHSGDMVLLDRVVSYDSSGICAELLVREDNAFLNDSGEFELYQSIELMAQSVGVLRGLANEKEATKLGFLLSVRGLKMRKNAVKIGTLLRVCAKISMRDENGFGLYECEVWEVLRGENGEKFTPCEKNLGENSNGGVNLNENSRENSAKFEFDEHCKLLVSANISLLNPSDEMLEKFTQ